MYLKTQIENLLRLAQAKSAEEPYYETLEYISLDGTQYFDTGILGNLNTKIEAGLSVTNISSNGQLFGARNIDANKSNIGCIFLAASGSETTHITLDFNNSSYATYRMSSSAVTVNTYYDIIVSKKERTVYLDGVSKGSNTQLCSDTFASQNTITIGKVNGATGLTYGSCPSTWKYFKIYDGSNLPMDLIPALDNKMRPCLYNRTTKTFLYAKKISDGTETYDLGFKRWNKYDVDYIQSSGTQYIDTGYAFADDFAYEVEYEGLNNGECLLGGRTSSVRTAILYRAMATQVDGQTTVPIAGLNATQTPFKLGVLSDTKHKVKVAIANNKGNVWVDDTQVYTNQSFTGTYISGKTTAIFADHFGDQTGTSEYQEYATSKLYALKFWQGTTLVRDYKPSVRTYNDGTSVVTKAFLYDEVYNKAYDNAGTGSFKAYITNISTTKTNVFTTTGATSGKAINAEGQIITSSASSYSALLPIVGGTVIECVSGDIGNNNYRFHTYDSNGNWIEQSLLLFAEGTGTVAPATGSFTAPINAKYVRVSYATSASSTIQVKSATETIYEVGKAIKYPQNNGFTLDAPDSSNFILDLLTRATTTSSYYMLDTRYQASSSNEEEFGIGGSSTGATVNWKCEGETILIKTNGTNWARNSNYTYSQMLVGYKEGNTFKRTASFYDFNNQKTSDVTVETATRDIANNTKPLTILHTTSSNWLQNGADIHYFKYLQDDNDVWHDCIPVRNATLTSSLFLFDRANNTSLPNTGSGTPTFVALD